MSMFIDGIPDKCDHDWTGDEVMRSASGKIIYWHTYRQWASLCSDARDRLIYEHHEKIDDPIVEGAVSCRKCKKVFHPPIFDI
jgi:hypothetical protein